MVVAPFAYLDNVVINLSTWSYHLATLKSVFQWLENASFTLNLAKCEFGKATVAYLGTQVGRGQVCQITGKVEAIVAFPALTT